MLVLTHNFAIAVTETTTLNLNTLATIFQLVSSFQNCELKQEHRTLSTELQQTHEFHGHGKTRTCILSTELQTTYEFHGQGKNIYSAAPEMGGRNCS